MTIDNDEEGFRKVRISLLQFWALSNHEKILFMPRKDPKIRYFISDSASWTTDPLKYLALQSTIWLDFAIPRKDGSWEGAPSEIAFLLAEILNHHGEIIWQIDRNNYDIEEDIYWSIVSRLARAALEAWSEPADAPKLPFEDLLNERSRKNHLKARAQPQVPLGAENAQT